MNTKTHTKTAGWPGPFTEAGAREYAGSIRCASITIVSIIQEDDGWYVIFDRGSTTLLLLDIEEGQTMNTKTHTKTTEGYPEAGPFETESEAMGAFVPPLKDTVLSVEHRDDGWYRTYMVNSTTSTYRTDLPSDWGRCPRWWRGILRRAREWTK
jgi:hypothetical protein